GICPRLPLIKLPLPASLPKWPYTLSFLYTGLSRPGKGFPSFQAMAYLNDQPFFRYESDGRKAEPLGPWSQVEGMEDWEKESELQKAREDIFMATLRDIMDYYKDREGSHTFQGRFGCELRNDQRQAAFWRYAYDGRDFIEFNKEIPAWVALDPAAVNTKLKWEAEAVYVQRAKAYLEEECPGMLRRYLEHGRGHLDRQGTRCFLRPGRWELGDRLRHIRSSFLSVTMPPGLAVGGRQVCVKCLPCQDGNWRDQVRAGWTGTG
uniref:MHC class I-like antigen recognition-like domain-containing protein n=1 Tax=Sus scrofa TaxID=9823 RepID=A0A8D0HUQ8_PIG